MPFRFLIRTHERRHLSHLDTLRFTGPVDDLRKCDTNVRIVGDVHGFHILNDLLQVSQNDLLGLDARRR